MVRFFRSSQGNEPVRDWLRSLSAVDRKAVGIARALFTIEAKEAILLHGFIKQSQRIPSDDLHTAMGRLKQLLLQGTAESKRCKEQWTWRAKNGTRMWVVILRTS